MKTRATIQSEIVLCLAGLILFLIPVVTRTGAFWGVNRTWTSLLPDRIRIDAVEPDSPASTAGLKPHDWVLSINDLPVDGIQPFDNELQQIQPGANVTLTVERDGETLILKGVGQKPQVAGVYMYDLQIVGIVVLTAIIAFLFATQPMQTTLWRSITVVVIGFVLAVLLLLTLMVPGIRWNIFSITVIRLFFHMNNDPVFPRLFQQPTCGVVAIGLIILGTLQVRRTLSLMAKSAVTFHEAVVENQRPAE